MASATLEEYLETIYRMSLRGEVRPSQIADTLGVSPPSVTSGLKRLEAAGLVTRPGGAVALTEQGRLEAMAILRRHRIAERFLVDVLGLGWDAAHEEACRLEHALSDEVLNALERLLDNPTCCPHGHPIPGSDGQVAAEAGSPLGDLTAGTAATVVSVPEEEEILAYMSALDLHPGQILCVEQSAPFDGPLLIEIAGRRAAMDRAIARRVIVRVDE